MKIAANLLLGAAAFLAVVNAGGAYARANDGDAVLGRGTFTAEASSTTCGEDTLTSSSSVEDLTVPGLTPTAQSVGSVTMHGADGTFTSLTELTVAPTNLSTLSFTSMSTTTLLVTITPSPALAGSGMLSVNVSTPIMPLPTGAFSTATPLTATSFNAQSGFSIENPSQPTASNFTDWHSEYSASATLIASSGFAANQTSVVSFLDVGNTVASPTGPGSVNLVATSSTELGLDTSLISVGESTTLTTTTMSSYYYNETITLSTITVSPLPVAGAPSFTNTTFVGATPTTTIQLTSTTYFSTVTVSPISASTQDMSSLSPEPVTTSSAGGAIQLTGNSLTTTTTVVVSLPPTTSTTTTYMQTSVETFTQPSTTTMSLALATSSSTSTEVESAGTSVSAGSTGDCGEVSTVTATYTVSVTVYEPTETVTVTAVASSAISGTSSSITPAISCAQDNCLRQFMQSTAVLGFCSSFTGTSVSSLSTLPAFASMCSEGPAQVSSACSCISSTSVPPGVAALASLSFTDTLILSLFPTTSTSTSTQYVTSTSTNTVPNPTTAASCFCAAGENFLQPQSDFSMALPSTPCACAETSGIPDSSTLTPHMPWMTYANGSSTTDFTSTSTATRYTSTDVTVTQTAQGVATSGVTGGADMKTAGNVQQLSFMVGVAALAGVMGAL